jgi:hypothetical protein
MDLSFLKRLVPAIIIAPNGTALHEMVQAIHGNRIIETHR